LIILIQISDIYRVQLWQWITTLWYLQTMVDNDSCD